MVFRKILIIVSFFICSQAFGESLSQQEIIQVLKGKIDDIKWLAQYSLIVNTVQNQNDRKMSLKEIKQIDKEWTSTEELTPFKKSLQEGSAGEFLKSIISGKKVFNEIFITDNQGANVIAYPATSDYWQGDEDKWKKAFNNGKGKIYIGPVEYDESTDMNAVQISVPILSNGKTIGVLIAGVKLSYIESINLKRHKKKREKQIPVSKAVPE